jgi:hypothetical protein
MQQQQQQIISMEMVENVTFRTLLTKLLNVVLAILAVILVFVSTLANCLCGKPGKGRHSTSHHAKAKYQI